MKLRDKIKVWNERRTAKKIDRFKQKLGLDEEALKLLSALPSPYNIRMLFDLQLLDEMQKRFHGFNCVTNYPIESYQASEEELEFRRLCSHPSCATDPFYVVQEEQR